MRPGSVTANISAIQSKLGLLRNEIVRKEVTNTDELNCIADHLTNIELLTDLAIQIATEEKEVENG
jgi:hypothetical protein